MTKEILLIKIQNRLGLDSDIWELTDGERKDIGDLIDIYAQQQTEELRKEVEELKEENDKLGEELFERDDENMDLESEITRLMELLEKCYEYIDGERICYESFPPKNEIETLHYEVTKQLLADIEKELNPKP